MSPEERVIEEARAVAEKAASGWCAVNGLPTHGYADGDQPEAIVRALHAAGLLVTPAMRECVEACVGFKRENASLYSGEPSVIGKRSLAVWDAGKAILAERTPPPPKPRWTASGNALLRASRADSFITFETEAQAKAVADALNALESR
jgi:hypothetical protein